MLWAGVLVLWSFHHVRAEGFPISITAEHQGVVYLRTLGSHRSYEQVAHRVPAVINVAPGERVDIRVVGWAGPLTNWVGERQGESGPAQLSIRQDRQPAWGRVGALTATLGAVVALSAIGLRRRDKAILAQAEDRLLALESGTSQPLRIAHYAIKDLLGEGAMAYVYRATDNQGRELAVKVPKTVDERFIRECAIASMLDSPYVVKAWDFCAEKKREVPAYLAQELLEGSTLKQRLTQGPLCLKDVDRYVTQLLEGLQAAHDHAIIHRDLKPENLFLHGPYPQDILKILDFGVARAEDALATTASGAFLGTPIYASPEQNHLEPLDERSDLYAVGLIIYEMLTGNKVWTASSRLELLRLQDQGPRLRLAQERPDCPKRWIQLIGELLRSQPEDRPPTAAYVRQRWQEHQETL